MDTPIRRGKLRHGGQNCRACVSIHEVNGPKDAEPANQQHHHRDHAGTEDHVLGGERDLHAQGDKVEGDEEVPDVADLQIQLLSSVFVLIFLYNANLQAQKRLPNFEKHVCGFPDWKARMNHVGGEMLSGHVASRRRLRLLGEAVRCLIGSELEAVILSTPLDFKAPPSRQSHSGSRFVLGTL